MAENNKNIELMVLYERIKPALITRKNELNREKLYNINEKDIWNYCYTNIWKGKKNLRIHELVDDILNVDSLSLEVFVRKYKGD